jgi:hypothetical protein
MRRFTAPRGLTNFTFLGNAPYLAFDMDGGFAQFASVGAGAKVYYYCGTTGWGTSYGVPSLPTVMLCPPQFAPGSAGVKPGGFGFTLNFLTNQTIVVEASTNLANWQPIWTNTPPGTSADFVDPRMAPTLDPLLSRVARIERPQIMKTRLIPLTLACLLVAAPATAQVNYAVSGDTAYVTYSRSASGAIVIASTYNGYPVTSILGRAFEGDLSLTSVTIPSSVTNVGSFAFRDCTSLTNLSVDAANPAYSSLNGVLFDKAQTTLIVFPFGRSGSYVIPNTVTNIVTEAFYSCFGLTERDDSQQASPASGAMCFTTAAA